MSAEGRRFYKMSGSGNDFVVFDARQEPAGALETAPVMQELCARGTGVGADGVVFVERAAAGGDFRMKYYNADGSHAAMCGNAALCATALAVKLGAGSASGMQIETDDGILTGRLVDGLPEVDLIQVHELRSDAGIPLEPGELRIGFALVGVPHLVVLCDDVTVVDAVGRGRPLRRHPSLAQGANVNFVSRRRDGWSIRTYERGVEAETLACGTGAIAAAVLLNVWGRSEPSETALQTKSGRRLAVHLQPEPGSWKPTLRGEGRLVFEGRIPV